MVKADGAEIGRGQVLAAKKSAPPKRGRNAAVSPAYLQTILTQPLPTKDGGTLCTVAEARAYMLSTMPS